MTCFHGNTDNMDGSDDEDMDQTSSPTPALTSVIVSHPRKPHLTHYPPHLTNYPHTSHTIPHTSQTIFTPHTLSPHLTHSPPHLTHYPPYLTHYPPHLTHYLTHYPHTSHTTSHTIPHNSHTISHTIPHTSHTYLTHYLHPPHISHTPLPLTEGDLTRHSPSVSPLLQVSAEHAHRLLATKPHLQVRQTREYNYIIIIVMLVVIS